MSKTELIKELKEQTQEMLSSLTVSVKDILDIINPNKDVTYKIIMNSKHNKEYIAFLKQKIGKYFTMEEVNTFDTNVETYAMYIPIYDVYLIFETARDSNYVDPEWPENPIECCYIGKKEEIEITTYEPIESNN